MTGYDFENIKLEIENNIATLTINRAEQMNALNTETLEEISEALDKVEEDGARCLIITGAGEKAFVSGADIKEMADDSPKEALEYGELGHKLYERLGEMAVPSIAAVNGFALGGGCELSLACDLRVASENATFGQPETDFGIIPGWGGTQRLSRIVGQTVAMDMILTADRISAEKALKIGLVNEVVPQEELMDKVKEKAQSIAGKSKIPIKTAKELIRASNETSLQTGLKMERIAFANLFDTHDQKEGMEAFMEKRKPEFKDE